LGLIDVFEQCTSAGEFPVESRISTEGTIAGEATKEVGDCWFVCSTCVISL